MVLSPICQRHKQIIKYVVGELRDLGQVQNKSPGDRVSFFIQCCTFVSWGPKESLHCDTEWIRVYTQTLLFVNLRTPAGLVRNATINLDYQGNVNSVIRDIRVRL